MKLKQLEPWAYIILIAAGMYFTGYFHGKRDGRRAAFEMILAELTQKLERR